MSNRNILSEVKAQVLYITINRENKMNALNRETLAELAEVIASVYENPQVRSVIIVGAGTKAFVAGADITEFAGYDSTDGEALARMGQKTVFDAIENCPKPVIAAINGFALGGGLELALACHIRIAADSAKLGLPEVTLGLIPGYGGTQRLTRLVGKGKAIEMITTAEMISASEAEKIGLVNHVVPMESLLEKAEDICSKIKLRAPLAVASALAAINAAADPESGFEKEIKEFGKCFNTNDFKEGVNAFLEKRQANFIGE